jgi:Mce-associated membrane protein
MPPAGSSRARVVLVVSSVIVVLAGVLSVLGIAHLQAKDVTSNRTVDQEADRVAVRSQVLGAAGQIAVDFTSVDYRHLSAEFKATAAHATPAFAKKYLSTVQAFKPLYTKGKVVLATSVDSAGIQALTANSAVVLVAVKGISTNTESQNGAEQLFRMQIDLSQVSGTWLASNVQPI